MESGETETMEEAVDVEPCDAFTDVGALILEGRLRAPSLKGYKEGPHAPPVSGFSKHECSPSSFLCKRDEACKKYMLLLWKSNVPMCIEVFLGPSCAHGTQKSQSLDPSVIPEPNYVLLEQWRIRLIPLRYRDLLRPVALSRKETKNPQIETVSRSSMGSLRCGKMSTEPASSTEIISTLLTADSLISVMFRHRTESIPLVPCLHTECISLTGHKNELPSFAKPPDLCNPPMSSLLPSRRLCVEQDRSEEDLRRCVMRLKAGMPLDEGHKSSSEDSLLGESLLDPPGSLGKYPRRYQSPSRCVSPSLEAPEHLLTREVKVRHSWRGWNSQGGEERGRRSMRESFSERKSQHHHRSPPPPPRREAFHRARGCGGNPGKHPCTCIKDKDVDAIRNIEVEEYAHPELENEEGAWCRERTSPHGGARPKQKSQKNEKQDLLSFLTQPFSGSDPQVHPPSQTYVVAHCEEELEPESRSLLNEWEDHQGTSDTGKGARRKMPMARLVRERTPLSNVSTSQPVTNALMRMESCILVSPSMKRGPCDESNDDLCNGSNIDRCETAESSTAQESLSARRALDFDRNESMSEVQSLELERAYLQRKLCLKRKDSVQIEGSRTVPSATAKALFRRSLDSAASLVFHHRSGLPLTSSPAPHRRGKAFDFDSSLNSVHAIKNALFDSDQEEEEEICEEQEPVKQNPSLTAPTLVTSSNLLGNFEESVLNGRLEPVSTVEGFTAEIGASGSFCPKHITLPVTVFFYTLCDNDMISSPYLCHINLGEKGYRVPRQGTIQVTLFNPHRTVVKMFVIVYNLEDMPPSAKTFLRQRTLYMPVASSDQHHDSQKWLRYLIHLRLNSSKSGHIYLHTDIRMIVFRKSDVDAAMLHSEEGPYELRSFTRGPDNPRFSPRK
ncbi:unnamed protein product [Darwinula stevensoni]|uniref:Atos-like conserved domain-containing protein n=1 Tax=Darwinula stevensoni TaxID=69355 RepID=A0A7R9A3G9_9CRUS|nr:unnamed protein product [Darwinula stevensoni]CAG0882124.1 unnamed protein product [Darwinula stevensoni]